ncbi:MAG: hypothetical protein ACOCYO_02540 [Bacteroidota bacterium]
MIRFFYNRSLSVFCFACLVLLNQKSEAQNPYSHILVESGGYVQMNFNSLEKYKEGISFENWTRIAITFTDDTDDEAEWKLEFKANSTRLNGDYGNTLPLETIEVQVYDAGGENDLGAFVEPNAQNLENNYITLVSGAPQGDFSDNKLYISYRIGLDSPLLGEIPDYYFVDVEFKLSKL